MDIKRLPLPIVDNNFFKFKYDEDKTNIYVERINEFIVNSNIKNTDEFTQHNLFPFEVKFNNNIENYKEDINYIMDLITNPTNKDLMNKENYQRVRNLVCGYRYILKNGIISKESLRILYDILSAGLLEKHDIIPMDEYYRKKDVFIYHSARLDVEPAKGAEAKFLTEHMDILFDYINSPNDNDVVNKFIKSQIMHLYFVYLHPYYDVNGRTARTLCLWFLNNNKAKYFTLFNRGINYTKQEYYRLVRHSIKSHDLTPFLVYMLKKSENELRKEDLIIDIEKELGSLNILEKQTIQYVLENKVNTALDFAAFYNRHNERKKKLEIYKEMLLPLIDKKIIIPTKGTLKNMSDGNANFFYEVNQELIKEKSIFKNQR